MSAHGQYPHPPIEGCDEFCPREYPGHGPYAHARKADCTDLCSEDRYSDRAEAARVKWQEQEHRKWLQRPSGTMAKLVPCAACIGSGFVEAASNV